jgi:hypothetical protein
VEAWLRRRFRRLVPSLVAAALALPVLTPISASAERSPEPASATESSFEALGSTHAERGPGRQDEARRLDATIAPAGLTLGEPLRAPSARSDAARAPDGATPSRFARWWVAHGTATAEP